MWKRLPKHYRKKKPEFVEKHLLQATSMKVIRRNEETNDIDEKSPFLEHSIPVTRSPKVSGAGVQLSFRVAKLKNFLKHFLRIFFSSRLLG